MIWIKALHIAAISFWSAILLCLPALYVQRAEVSGKQSLHRLQAMVRYIYVGVLSPAAFVAIASGTWLIFERETFEAWFSVKLVLVGILSTIHALTGLVIIRLFEKDNVYPAWRFVATTTFTILVIVLILTVVLLKPRIPNIFPVVMSEPGGLSRLLGDLNPFHR
jgi:putative membrane protein